MVYIINHKTPFLYEISVGNFSGALAFGQINEEEQVVLSVFDYIQRILNARSAM